MNIVILSRGPGLYSTRSLVMAGYKRGHKTRVIDYMDLEISLAQDHPQLLYRGEPLTHMDAVIPRIGASLNYSGSAIIKQLESMNIFTVTGSNALNLSRDKLGSLQMMTHAGVSIPNTFFPGQSVNIERVIEHLGSFPLVIKLLRGTHGLGVMLGESKQGAEAIIETLLKLRQKFIIQEFIKEASGADIRAFVVNGEVVAAMKRRAMPGEFRSNLHRGGSAIHIKLTSAEEEMALKAVKVLGLQIAGVDMLQSERGPLLLEVNPSPGLEGISKTTNVDVAGKIIEYIESVFEQIQNFPGNV